MRSTSLLLAMTVAIVAACASTAHATWSHDPNVNLPVCTVSGSPTGLVGTSDGAGGAYLAWGDPRTDAADVYVQHVTAAGTIAPGWPANGLAVCTAINQQFDVQLLGDGSGGVYVAWSDSRPGALRHTYVQHLTALGALVAGWPANGLLTSWSALYDELRPRLALDGLGGLYVTWQLVFGVGDDDVYVSRLNSNGTVATGFPTTVNGAGGEQIRPVVVSTPSNGAIVTFADNASGTYDIHLRRFNASGAMQMDQVLGPYPSDQMDPRAIPDGYGGEIIAYTDFYSSPPAVAVSRVTPTGIVLWGPTNALIQGSNSTYVNTLVSDGAGGAYVFGNELNFLTGFMRATHVLASGFAAPGWSATGLEISRGYSPVLVATPDGFGGMLAFNTGGNSGFAQANRLYGSGVAPTGWPYPTSGVQPTLGYVPFSPAIVADGSGGAIVAWVDYRNGTDYDVFAQRIERFGKLGNPEPVIAGVKDVPLDQGGKVRVSWSASYLDAQPLYEVASYRVWRQVPAASALAALARGQATLDQESDAEGSRSARLVRTTQTSAGIVYWELTGTQPASGQAGYSLAASTGGDSVAAGNPRTLFMVEALGTNTQLWDSAADSGYSVDNLPPVVPAPFTAAYAVANTHLAWGPNSEADLAGYRLYRGISAGFVPSPVTLIAEQADTGYIATPGNWYYKLTAVDIHGNESLAALVSPSGTVDAPSSALPAELAMSLASANPSRGPATLRLALPRESRVSANVFDAAGRDVRSLVAGTLPAGTHVLVWDGRDATGAPAPGGLYFVRTIAGGRTFDVRVVRLR